MGSWFALLYSMTATLAASAALVWVGAGVRLAAVGGLVLAIGVPWVIEGVRRRRVAPTGSLVRQATLSEYTRRGGD